MRWNTPPTPGALARVRVILSRSVITYSAPSVPLAGTARFHRTAAYTRCLRCAGAPRRPASGSGLSLSIPSWHAILYRPRGLRHRQFQTAMSTWPSPRDHRLGIPDLPAIRFTRGNHFVAYTVRTFATACQFARPPCTDPTSFPAVGDFYYQASNGSVALPVAGYNYNSDWTPLLVGLTPTGMAASLAAPELGT